MESTIDYDSTPASETACHKESPHTTRRDIAKPTHEGSSFFNNENDVTKYDSNNIDNDLDRPQIEKYEIFQKVLNSNKLTDKYEHVFKKPFPYKALGNKESIPKSTLTESNSGSKESFEYEALMGGIISNEIDRIPLPIDIDTGVQDSLHKQTNNDKQSSREITLTEKIIEGHITTEIYIESEEAEKEQPSKAIDTSDENYFDNINHKVNIKKEISQKKETEEQTLIGDKSCNKRLREDANVNEDSLLVERILPREELKRRKVDLFTEDKHPHWYDVKGNVVTPPIIPINLPKVFESLPIFGKPKSKAMLHDFLENKLRYFMGSDLGDKEFDVISKYCSTDHLKTGNELVMRTSIPTQGLLKSNIIKDDDDDEVSQFDIEDSKLCTVKKYKLRLNRDPHNRYSKKLKYRGVRLIPLQEEDSAVHTPSSEPELEPGRDILFRVRVYRPYAYHQPTDRIVRGRHSVFSSDIVLVGRQSLTELRDRIVCRNEQDMRVDVSADPTVTPLTTAKEVFPSGFLFINNVFYVDNREPSRCVDHTARIRAWADSRGLGLFPARDMASMRIDQLLVKLGHPDVYVHQGNCEHLFMFSEIRLLNAKDPLSLSYYPCHTAFSQNQTVYCTTCAEYCAKWIVVGCNRVPFDPAFFCETCFKLYLYKDGEKIGDFKAYSYRGNEMNMLKTQKNG